MAYDKHKNEWKKEEGEKSDGREPGKPHPDAGRNIEFMDQWLSLGSVKKLFINPEECSEIPDGMLVKVFDGVNRRTTIDPFTNRASHTFDELACVSFYWNKMGRKFGMSFNYHQPHQKFREMVERFFSFSSEKPSSMKDVPRRPSAENDQQWAKLAPKGQNQASMAYKD